MTSLSGTFNLLMVTCICVYLPTACIAGGLRGSLGEITSAEVDTSLISELIGVVDNERPLQLELALRLTYDSLPKNAFGNLDHQAVRYVLHRMFVQRHGWFIKGLEPDGNDTDSTIQQPLLGDEWVPSYLQRLLEQRLGTHGMNLRELATVAATLERLIHAEAGKKLQVAYNAHGFSTDAQLTAEDAQRVINTFMVDFLEPGEPINTEGPGSIQKESDARARFDEFAATYTGWPDVEEWLRGVEMPHLGSTANRQFNFSSTQRIIEDIGEQYGHFNDMECRSLKTTLMGMEDKQPGRVWLSEFYKKSLYSHWQFTEKIDYLRQLGALDETDANGVQVIVPNYIGARPNCLEASNIYAICCRNECEDLMGYLERKIAAPSGEADRIAALVSALPTGTVNAPRVLPDRLMRRLNQVASNNGGKVPLHGRLFAQWMHHAFPRECPYPHEAGTVNPMTPDEWLKSTGHESVRASEAELLEHAEGTQLQIRTNDGIEDDPELPWSHTEELLSVRASVPRNSVRTCSQLCLALLVFLAIAKLVHCWFKSQRRGSIIGYEEDTPLKPAMCSDNGGSVILVTFCVLSVFVLVFDLLDPTVFIGAVLCGGAWLSLQRMLSHGPAVAKKFV